MYALTHFAYCGMSIPLGKGEHDEMRSKAARILQARRADGFPVSVLKPGREWEIQEPEDCFMIPDTAGLLVLQEIADDSSSENIPDDF